MRSCAAKEKREAGVSDRADKKENSESGLADVSEEKKSDGQYGRAIVEVSRLGAVAGAV